MAMFEFLRKKRQNDLPLPPPPLPPPMNRGDFPQIRAPPLPPEPTTYNEPLFQNLPVPLPSHEEHQEPHLTLPELPAMEREVEEPIFDRTIERPREKEVIRQMPRQSFVAVEDFKQIINDTNVVRAKLMEADNFVKRLTELKNEEERSLEKWRAQLEDVEKKLTFVDHVIEKAQR